VALLEGGAEVADLGLARLGKQDVAGLDVAVDDAVLEGVLERADALEDDLDHLASGSRLFTSECASSVAPGTNSMTR